MKDKNRARNRKSELSDLRARLAQTKLNYRSLYKENRENVAKIRELVKEYDGVARSINSWIGAAITATGKSSMVLKKTDLVKQYEVVTTKQDDGDYLVEVKEI